MALIWHMKARRGRRTCLAQPETLARSRHTMLAEDPFALTMWWSPWIPPQHRFLLLSTWRGVWRPNYLGRASRNESSDSSAPAEGLGNGGHDLMHEASVWCRLCGETGDKTGLWGTWVRQFQLHVLLQTCATTWNIMLCTRSLRMPQ